MPLFDQKSSNFDQIPTAHERAPSRQVGAVAELSLGPYKFWKLSLQNFSIFDQNLIKITVFWSKFDQNSTKSRLKYPLF